MSDQPTPSVAQTKQVALEWVAVQDSVAAYIGSMVRHAADRDDLVQKTALYLLEHADDYTGEGFLRWAIQIARYRVLEHWQVRGRDERLKRRLQVTADAFIRIEEAGDGASDTALQTCLSRLSKEQRRLMERRYVEDTPLNELAAELNRPANSLANAFYRIRNALARCILNEMGKEGYCP